MEEFKAIKFRTSDYEFLQTLGTGSFGRVKLVRHRRTGEFFALKLLKKAEILLKKQTDHVYSENAILSRINHPFMVRMLGFAQNERYLYFLMDFVQGGELFTLLRTRGKLTVPEVIFYTAQIVLMFEYLHSKKIIYRDLKPENLLLGKDGYLRLCDFGFAKFVHSRTYTLCGTPEYIAPEILLNQGYGKPADWWALGVFVFETLAGIDPFNAEEPMALYQNILKCEVVFPEGFEKSAEKLVKSLLVLDLTKRLGELKDGIRDIKEQEFLKEVRWEDLLEKRQRPPNIPEIRGPSDTSNFLTYKEEEEDTKGLSVKEDPFINW